jgi:hypothetical protein
MKKKKTAIKQLNLENLLEVYYHMEFQELRKRKKQLNTRGRKIRT